MAGLIAGKFIGILLVCFVAIKSGLARLPENSGWLLLSGAAMLGGIGFTMSIFITNLAFTDQGVIDSSKMAILIASAIAALLGLILLFAQTKKASGRSGLN